VEAGAVSSGVAAGVPPADGSDSVAGGDGAGVVAAGVVGTGVGGTGVAAGVVVEVVGTGGAVAAGGGVEDVEGSSVVSVVTWVTGGATSVGLATAAPTVVAGAGVLSAIGWFGVLTACLRCAAPVETGV
jgi:hypothetical protein